MKLSDLYEYKEGKLFFKASRGGQRAGVRAGTLNPVNGYRYVHVQGKLHAEHRVIWFLHHDAWPDEVDHINNIRDDNRIENLRQISRQANVMKRGMAKTNPYGFKGVRSKYGGKSWTVEISVNRQRAFIGTFADKYDAATAYNFAAAELHGEFAVFNTVPQPWLEE